MYCPVGEDSRKQPAMETRLTVESPRAIRVTGGGPVIQVLPGTGEPAFDAPGGFLFVNWEKSGAA